jgi:ferric-dicitrate binding protein FerR (iron transport regulator)
MEMNMIKNKTLAAFLIGVMLLAACQQQTASSALSAALSELVGKVEIKAADSEAFAPADANSVLEANGQVQTGDDGRVRLDLSSGTIIRIASSSSFTLTSNEETEGGLITKINLLAGKVFIILNGGTAEVETPSGVASVRGSYMKVEVDPENGDVYVTCLEGNCSAQNPAGGVEFTQGQKTILFHKDPATGNWTIPNVEPMTPEEFQEWLDNNPEAKELFEQAMATATALALPSPTATVPATPTLVSALPEEGGSSSSACKLVAPPAGASLEFQGKMKFEWEPQAGAQKYVLTFITSNGNTVSFETTETSIEKYIEIFPAEGEYQWNVTAYGADGAQLCQSETAGFTKPNSVWVNPNPKPAKPEEGSPSCDPDPFCESSNCCYGS